MEDDDDDDDELDDDVEGFAARGCAAATAAVEDGKEGDSEILEACASMRTDDDTLDEGEAESSLSPHAGTEDEFSVNPAVEAAGTGDEFAVEPADEVGAAITDTSLLEELVKAM